MIMAVNIRTIFRLSVLLFIACAVIQLAGCKGATSAPAGSKITLETFGSPIFSNLTTTAIASKTQNYRVTVVDAGGNPLNGIDVDFMGQFTNGVSIVFGGPTGSAPATLSTTKTTDDFGYLIFPITATYYAISPIHVPYNQTATGSPTGGQLDNGTYFYTVTALDYAGETEATASISAVVTGQTSTSQTGSVTVSWQAVPGATSYRIYGRISGSVGAMITLLNPSGDPLTWVDTGSATPTSTSPPITNTTGLSLNSVVGTIIATTGSAIDTLDVSF
jgi:hypothetical protein